MKNQIQPPHDERLSALLRESRPAPNLPPGFQNAVWRRLEHTSASSVSVSLALWLDRVADWLLRPRLMLAGGAALLVVGIAIGVVQGGSLANNLAKQQYLAAVNPFATR
jgi:hypothetical protein